MFEQRFKHVGRRAEEGDAGSTWGCLMAFVTW